MPVIESRDLDPSDLDAALRVRSLSFGPFTGNLDDWRAHQQRMIEERRVPAAYVDGHLAGMARIVDFRQWWHGRDLPMGGVASVVVGPEHRGRGVGIALMTGVVARLRELGYPLSALYPMTSPLYRALGWELVGRQHRVSVPGGLLRTLARTLQVPVPLRRAVSGDGQAIIDRIDARHRAHLDDGPLAYSVADWEEDLGDDEDTAIYLAEDGVVAYDWNGPGTLHVSHLSAASEATTRTLWALVGSGSSAARTVTADLAPDDPLPRLLPDLGPTPSKETWWMLRLLDPAAAFAGRGYPVGASVNAVIDLVDPQLPDLDGRWRLSVEAGAASFARVPAADAGEAYEIGPRGLAALFGGTRLSVLRRSGVIGGGSPGGDAALDAAFAGTPFLIDYF